MRQSVIPVSGPTESFKSFTVKISETSISISSLKEMGLKAREIAQLVSDRHIKIRIDIPSHGLERAQAMKFIEELKSVVHVSSTRWTDLFDVVSKKTEEIQENLTIRKYNNGVIEEVQSSRENEAEDLWTHWEGRRIYPDGVIETGRFDNFCFHKGTRTEKEITTYKLPDCLVKNYSLDRSLIYSDIEGEKKLIVIGRKPGSGPWDCEYVQVKEELIPTLAEILKKTNDVRETHLREIFSGPINCEEFVSFLFETNSIFSLQSYPLCFLLKSIQEKGLVVNLRQHHPETGETFLDLYAGNTEVLKTLLAIDPALIERRQGMEIPFVRSLLAGNQKGASFLFATMEEQKIALLPRELLFKKVAFSEGELTPEELQMVPLEDREIVYRLANIYSQLNAVRIMRTLGFGRNEELLMPEGPSIFGCNMDALEMHDRLADFLIHLRSQKLLLTQSEFDQLSEGNYINKGNDIGRIAGRDYIEKKAGELGLKHVKVPKKMIVIPDVTTNLALYIDKNLCIQTSSDGITVYAEPIQGVKRAITAEEVSELLRLFEATGFNDIHWSNVIVAQDGVYIIDTEFTNFWATRLYFKKGRQYVEMAKIVHALPIEQQQTLIDQLNAKMEMYQKHEEELDRQRMLRLQVEWAALVKFGFYKPCFDFPVNELII